MCGLAGIVNFGGEPVDRQSIVRMTETLEHRGPDGSGIWICGHVGLGHRRLAIRDLSEAGSQPMIDTATKLAVVYNGELYNDLNLRRTLGNSAGTRFHSTCDTEVIRSQLSALGQRCISEVRGHVRDCALGSGERAPCSGARPDRDQTPLFFLRWTVVAVCERDKSPAGAGRSAAAALAGKPASVLCSGLSGSRTEPDRRDRAATARQHACRGPRRMACRRFLATQATHEGRQP
jgi:hypothetical protein